MEWNGPKPCGGLKFTRPFHPWWMTLYRHHEPQAGVNSLLTYSWLNTRTDIASDWNILHVGASILLTLWAWQVKSCIENFNLLQAYSGHDFFVNYSRILITSFVNLEAPYWGREGIMAYKRTSHPSNIKTWSHIILLPKYHFKWFGTRLH